MPARELCILARAKQRVSLVDGAQAPGSSISQLAAMGCDAYATSFHKWLNGSYGTGALYVRPRAPSATLAADGRAADRLGPRRSLRCLSATARERPADRVARGAGQVRPGARAAIWPRVSRAASIAIELQQAVNRARIGARQRELATYLRLQLAGLAGRHDRHAHACRHCGPGSCRSRSPIAITPRSSRRSQPRTRVRASRAAPRRRVRRDAREPARVQRSRRDRPARELALPRRL